ncbi:unnamed protein product [Caenorhabditis auriculariae]|uniref:Ribosomal RNA-processing protein 12-like conserved domain-containing protein n=1 Tax=Caenorhabditis auriculariae TaxID=2777116 RepID=A0A8S1HNT3_9PELO|nr:unnamed protein product [Caenorhabditis auriculariae]
MSGGKFRKRVHTKGATRVPKGFACSSNPTKNRHRIAAQSARQASSGGSSMVAVDDRAPNAADDMLSALPISAMDIGGSSSKSMISEGGISQISEFTACTNPAFDPVNRIWKSGSSIQSEVVSVLAAIAELIKEKDGKESDVEYFSALLTALEGASLGNVRRTAAIAYLLHLIVRKVPKEVLQSQFTRAVQTLYTKLLENVDSSEGSALKNLISVLGIILRAQPSAVWNGANTRNILVSVAALSAHEKPWVRTMARRVLRAVLTDPVTATDDGLHPASGVVGNFILQHVRTYTSQKGDNTMIVRYFCLLEGIMHKMPSSLFEKLAEQLLECFAQSDPMVKCSAMQCLYRSFQRQPCDSALRTEANVLLISALRKFCPSAADVTITAYWLQTLSEAHVCLTAKDSARSTQMLNSSLSLIVKLFDSGNDQLAQITYQVLTRIVENCVKDDGDCGKYLLSLLDASITMKSAAVWKFILRTQMKLYEVCGEALQGPEFTKSMVSLAQLRQSDECFCRPELDFTIGSAVRHVGVGPVLNAIPLEVDADAAVLSSEFSRSWLLPILRVNIHNAPLSLFISTFLPVAVKIYKRLNTLHGPLQRVYTTFQFQLWELLQSFCESPSDLETSFPDIAPILGAALRERKDLRMTVLASIRRALRFSIQPDAPPERSEVMGRFAKNYMPMLFNMYTAGSQAEEYDDKGVRLSVLETIRVYAEVAPQDLLDSFVDSAILKSQENGESTPETAQKQNRVLDILCALTRSVDTQAISKILDAIRQWFDSTDTNGYQKKAYRILEEILQRRSSSEIEVLIESRQDYIENVVMKPLNAVNPPSRASYCSCIHMLCDKFENLSGLRSFAEKIIDSVILLLDKENNTHTRQNASKCLQFLSAKMIELGAEDSESPSNVLNIIFSHIFEMTNPKEGKNHGSIELNVARSALVALNILTQKQIKVLNATLTSRVVSHASAWISDGRAPVRILAIRLMRVLVQKLPEYALHQYREQILTTVFEGQLTCDITVKVRKANRLLLEVLVEKFGVNILEKYTKKPDWIKQIKNIDKMRRRKERKAAGNNEKDSDEDDQSMISGSHISGRTAGADTILELLEDSDDENESDAEEKLMQRSRVGSVWLRDDMEGDVMDLLDSSHLINKVTTTDPALLEKKKKKMQERKAKNESGFKFTKDGKLIILDDEMEEKKNNRKRKNGLDELDDDEMPKKGKRQREGSDFDSNDDDDDIDGLDDDEKKTTVSRATTSRTFGGKGIYRDTSASQVGSTVRSYKKRSHDKKPQKKTGAALQPYAYVPLRDKAARQNVRKVLKAKRKVGRKNK